MIKSMTGYGKSSASAGSKTVTAEVRSLNSKGLDMSVKLPAAYRPLEYELRAAAAAAVSRGKADVFISVEDAAAGSAARVDAAVFADYYKQIAAAAAGAGVSLGGGILSGDMFSGGAAAATITAAIMRLPDVLTTCEASELPDDESAAVRRALTEALAAFDAFRAQEGAVLMADLSARVDTIERLLDEVAPLEAARIPAVRARIMENIAAAGVTVDPNRLEQELVFWVEKLDVTEEKVRLRKHLDYFRSTVASDDDGVGRKLGFIAQEMGREINTLGSKANDAAIQRIVVQMKDELEKIKEQLLNIL